MWKYPKSSNISLEIQMCFKNGKVLDTYHARERKSERSVSRQEILEVFSNGRLEPSKDTYNIFYHTWNYSIIGKTIDGVKLRIIISIIDEVLFIITVIRRN